VMTTVRSVPGVRPERAPLVVAWSSSYVIPGRTSTNVDHAFSSGEGVRSSVKESGVGARGLGFVLLLLLLVERGDTGGRL
jgi:hypothetical protein